MTEKEYTTHRGKKTMEKQAKAVEAKVISTPNKEEIKKEVEPEELSMNLSLTLVLL